MKYVILLSFLIQVQFVFSDEFNIPPLHYNKEDTLIQSLLGHRTKLVDAVKMNKIEIISNLIDKGDIQFVGVEWITPYERTLAYLISGSLNKIKNEPALLISLWQSPTYSYPTNIPNALCPPKKTTIYHFSINPTVQLEHYLWDTFLAQIKSNLMPKEIVWIKNNSVCNQQSYHTPLRDKLNRAKLKDFKIKFPNSKYLPKSIENTLGDSLYWSGNGFLFSLGYVNNQFFDNTSKIITDGSSFGFGMTAYFPHIMTSVILNIKNFNLSQDHQFKDSTFSKGESAEYSQINWIVGYPIRPLKGLVIAPYSGWTLSAFEGKVQSNDSDERDEYELKAYGYPIGVLFDYSLNATTETKRPGVGFTYGLRGGLQYTYTNLSSLSSQYGDNNWTTRVEFTFGLVGVDSGN